MTPTREFCIWLMGVFDGGGCLDLGLVRNKLDLAVHEEDRANRQKPVEWLDARPMDWHKVRTGHQAADTNGPLQSSGFDLDALARLRGTGDGY